MRTASDRYAVPLPKQFDKPIPFKNFTFNEYDDVLERIYVVDDLGMDRDMVTCKTKEDAVQIAVKLNEDERFSASVMNDYIPRVLVFW